MVCKFFDKKIRSRANLNAVLAQELPKSVVEKFERRKVYSRVEGNIWAADFTEMGSLSSKNQGVEYSVIDVFTKYDWVKPLKDKKAKTVNESKYKPNKLWIDKEEVNSC